MLRFASYLLSILEDDVRNLAHIHDVSALARILTRIAARTATLLNFAELARSLDIPQTTLKRYFALLEATFLVQLVPAWSASAAKRLIETPKLFLNDTGLAAHLLGLTREQLQADAALRGPLLENFVGMELLKQAAGSRRYPDFRTAAGQEVDFVVENCAAEVAGIEVKPSATVTPRDFRGLRALAETAGARFRRGIVLYTGNTAVTFGPELYALPVAALWETQEV